MVHILFVFTLRKRMTARRTCVMLQLTYHCCFNLLYPRKDAVWMIQVLARKTDNNVVLGDIRIAYRTHRIVLFVSAHSTSITQFLYRGMASNHVVNEVTGSWWRSILAMKRSHDTNVIRVVLHQDIQQLVEIAVEVVSSETSLCREEGLEDTSYERMGRQGRVDEVACDATASILHRKNTQNSYCSV